MKTAMNNKLLLTILILKLGILSCSKSPDPTPVTPPNQVTGITVTTQPVFQITANAAQCGGTIALVAGGAPIITRGICWNSSPNPTTANNKTSDGSVIGTFFTHMSGLSLATTYYVRAYATNGIGTTYGNEINFTTLPSIIPPQVATNALTSLTPTTAICGGSILLDGGAPIIARGVCWSTAPTPTIANSITSDGTGGGVFISNITGLAANTQYYLRSYATNSAGTAYGDEIIFKTPDPGIIFFGTNDNFYAINRLTGQLKWKYASALGFNYAGPCYSNGKIYTGGINGFLYCLDTLNGNVVWSYFTGSTGIECDPVYDNGTIYFGSNDDNFYALDAASGALKWKYLTGANVSSSPVISNGIVYFGSADTKVYALNATTGLLIWSYQTTGMIVSAGPALVNGLLYIGNRTGNLYALNINTGLPVWNIVIPSTLEFVSPTVVNNILYIHGGSRLYAINANTGQILWEKLMASSFSSSAPIVADGRLFVGTTSEFYALDAITGQIHWSKIIFPNGASATVMHDIVYVGGAASGYFYAFDVLNGSEKWKFAVNGGFLISGPCVVSSSSVKHSGESGMQQ